MARTVKVASSKARNPKDTQAPVEPQKTTVERPKREIPGGLPYTTTPGILRKVLDAIPVAERPAQFTLDFLSTVLGVTGGSARPIIPILKKANFLEADGRPTELYDRFRTQGGRTSAALQGLRNAFETVFRLNSYAHKADETALRDIIVRITGLPKDDKTVASIISTFQTLKSYVPSDFEEADGRSLIKFEGGGRQGGERTFSNSDAGEGVPQKGRDSNIGISYKINLILPDTADPEVFDAIFKSLRENLL